VPDVALLKPRDDFYAKSHPVPGDVLLIVEVADTSLDYDRTVKVPRYAAAGIPEVWLVDLPGERVETYSQPARGTFAVRRTLARGDSLRAQEAEIALSVDSILG
jgi:Uma2 family endonuclease